VIEHMFVVSVQTLLFPHPWFLCYTLKKHPTQYSDQLVFSYILSWDRGRPLLSPTSKSIKRL
jgi:hypothetical protein